MAMIGFYKPTQHFSMTIHVYKPGRLQIASKMQ